CLRVDHDRSGRISDIGWHRRRDVLPRRTAVGRPEDAGAFVTSRQQRPSRRVSEIDAQTLDVTDVAELMERDATVVGAVDAGTVDASLPKGIRTDRVEEDDGCSVGDRSGA